MVATAAEVPEKNKRRSVRDNLKHKRKNVISKAKACKIMGDKEVHGKKLTGPQHRFMAARCSGQPVKKGS